ncbi:hypothetical protein Mal4_21360 [Maioricimonas rarisocia]|uniref:Uncharacterized protein n=1 Tax=Maioricimonas rarisocia TaxID=2528026 RepID=A0A517Z5X1_9PLAN|nr:hypothetical protein [Maioricimonas rarisocia]QDU37819.1 hypothetical protein Mal4_21360 [Maioricimonas rarisocia]
MKKWLTSLGIAGYLALLGYGIACHTLGFNTYSHPGMYFLVWDMYCGWGTYENRLHVIGEGASGRYYELTPAPWGEFHPFGRIGRQNYDPNALHVGRMGLNTLRYTDHEPIDRIIVIEENWPKKYNLPDHLWARRYDEPKDPQSYYHLRAVFDTEGKLVRRNPVWENVLAQRNVLDNPRLMSDMTKGRPYVVLDPSLRNRSAVTPASYQVSSPSQ